MAFNTIKVNDGDTGYVHSIFDISEYNAGACYENLSAALAVVPDNKKKGGMSIRFIQGSVPSSDNKYVQCFLTKNEWSANEADWQSMNVDEVPVAASDNLVKSGGVSEELYGLVVKDETLTYTGFQNKVYSPISAGEKYEIQITSEASFKVTVQVNTTNSYVVLEEITDSEKHYITIPQNLVGTTLYFTATDITVHLRLIKYRENSIKEIIDETIGNVATLNTSMTNEEKKSDVIFDDLLYIASAVKKIDSDVNNRILFNKEYVNNSETDWVLKKITWYAKDNSCKFYVCILKPTITTDTYYILDESYIGSSVAGINEKEVDVLVPKGCCVGIHGTNVAGDTMPEWGYPSSSGTLGCMHNTFRDISHVSVGSTVSFVNLTRSTAYGCLFAKESFLSEGQPYVIKRVVAANQNNYNSIRDVVNSIDDASPSKIYHVIVPKGRWFESDLSGKPYVKIIGEDREESIVYCDGDADKPIPSNYAGGDYDEKSDFSYSDSLAETKKIYKHCVYCAAETYISNLRIEAHNTKYCVHIDSTHCNKAVFENCHIYAIKDGTFAKELNHPIGIGLRGNQFVDIKNCIIESEIVGIGVFAHNFANSTSGCKLSIQNCYFKNCGYLKTGELGSGQNDIFELLNCTSDIKIVQAEVDATTTEENPQNVPYSIKVNACGTDVAAVQTPVVKGVVSRPNFVYDFMSNYAIVMGKSDVPACAIGKVYTGYMVITDKYIRVRSANIEPQNPIVGVVFNMTEKLAYLVPKRHVAMIPVSAISSTTKTGTAYVDTNGYLTTDIASSVTNIGAIGVLYAEYNTSDYVYLAMF